MKFVVDENLHGGIVARLREDGHEVSWIAEFAPRMIDEAVLGEAERADALLLTEDKDFGELVFRQRLVSRGVVLLRLGGLSPETKSEILARTLEQHGSEMVGAFTVIAPGVVRIRRALD